MPVYSTTDVDRFWGFVQKTETCWLWRGAKRDSGHGRFCLNRGIISAHRFAYELCCGTVPAGLDVVVSCGVRACVRPSHLSLGSRNERMGRRSAHPVYSTRSETLIHDPVDRFWSKVRKTDTCWLWTGAEATTGYGVTSSGHGKNKLTHRYSYALAYGPVPAGMVVRHLCSVPLCVRPEHLALGSPADNVRDSIRAGRFHRGERSGSSRLTERQVKEILHLAAEQGWGNRRLGRRFNVSRGTILAILRGETWRHVQRVQLPLGV